MDEISKLPQCCVVIVHDAWCYTHEFCSSVRRHELRVDVAVGISHILPHSHLCVTHGICDLSGKKMIMTVVPSGDGSFYSDETINSGMDNNYKTRANMPMTSGDITTEISKICRLQDKPGPGSRTSIF